MARFYGKIGYGESAEVPPGSGVYVDQITEYSYFGNVIRNSSNLSPSENSLTGDISLGNSISILADAEAIENHLNIRYVEWDGRRWTVTSVEVQRPRLILNMGGVYNGPTP